MLVALLLVAFQAASPAGSVTEAELRAILDAPLPPRPELSRSRRAEVEALVERRKVAQSEFVESGDRAALERARAALEAELAIRWDEQGAWTAADGGSWWELRRLEALGDEYARMAAWSEAERERARGLEDLERSAVEAFREHRFDEAVARFDEALAARVELFGQGAYGVAVTRNNRAVVLSRAARRRESIEGYRAAASDYRRVLGVEHPETLAVRRRLSNELSSGGSPVEAADILWSDLEVYRRLVGYEHPTTLAAQRELGRQLSVQRRWREAALVLRRAVEVGDRVEGPDARGPWAARAMLADVLAGLGEVDEAEAMYAAALTGISRVQGAQSSEAFHVRAKQVVFLREHRGEIQRAVDEGRELLAEVERTLGPGHADTLWITTTHASSLIVAGELREALSLLTPALEAHRLRSGPGDRSCIEMAHVMSTALRRLGRLEEAERIAREAVRWAVDGRGGADSTTLEALEELGEVLSRTGRFDEAVVSMRTTWETSRSVFGPEDQVTLVRQQRLAGALARLGRVMRADGETDGTRAFLEEAVELARDAAARLEEHVGAEHESTLFARGALAYCLIQAGLKEEAVELREEAFERSVERHGPGAPQTLRRGHSLAATLLWTEAPDLDRVGRLLEPLVASEDFAREPEWAVVLHQTLGTAALADGRLEEALTEYDVAFERTLELRGAAADGELRAAVEGRLQLEVLGARMARIHARLDDPAGAWDRLEATRGRTLLELLSDGRGPEVLGARELHAGMGESELLVGVLWSTHDVVTLTLDPRVSFEDSARAHVAADDPESVARLVRSAAKVRAWMSTPGGSEPGSDARALFEELFTSEMRETMSRAGRIVYLPDGSLSDLPLASLATVAGFERVAPAVVYAPSGSVYLDRRAARRRAGELAPRGLVALGDPAFDPDADVPLASLPGSRREVRHVADLVRARDLPARVLLGEDATAEALSEAAGEARWLHLATHGRMGSRAHPFDARLSLAGASARDLTLRQLFEEWSHRLERCELVVLSACDTQRGARRGASLVALPWGFFHAGAHTVVASLWPVDDEATSLLMARFYANLLDESRPAPSTDGGHILAALTDAQHWLRDLTPAQLVELRGAGALGADARRGVGLDVLGNRDDDDAHPFADPSYWAAFVVVGDPGSSPP